MLDARGLHKKFGNVVGLGGVSFQVAEGEFFSILGPSGCGKTTLLRILAGFEAPDPGGELWFDGRRIDGEPPHQRQFNLIFQRYALFPHLSVRENIAFGLRMKKVPEPELSTRVWEALALVRMEDCAKRAVSTLSGGQQQRIAVARAVVNRPRVLLLDEPLSALDLKLRQRMQVELRSLQRKLGLTFIFVTHDQEEALTLSDRVAVMNKGLIEQIGTPREIYAHPKSRFVSTFIGMMNRWPATVQRVEEVPMPPAGGGSPTAVVYRHEVSVAEIGVFQVEQEERLEGEVDLLVRPEQLLAGKRRNTIHVRVREVLFQGALTMLIGEDTFGRPVVAHEASDQEGFALFRFGDHVELGFDADNARLMKSEGKWPPSSGDAATAGLE